jgi:TPR repeat protein
MESTHLSIRKEEKEKDKDKKQQDTKLFQEAYEWFSMEEYDKAFPVLFQLATTKNHVPSMYYLGCYYRNEKQDLSSSFQWMLLAGQAGYELAFFPLGQAYYDGKSGVAKNEKLAFEWLQKCTNSEGRLLLCLCYLYGKGTTQNETKGTEITNKLNDPQGYFNLAQYWSKQKKQELAFENYEKAAHLGHTDAMVWLAQHYRVSPFFF